MQEQDTSSQGSQVSWETMLPCRDSDLGHTDTDTRYNIMIVGEVRRECGPHPLWPLSPGQRQQPLSGGFNE